MPRAYELTVDLVELLAEEDPLDNIRDDLRALVNGPVNAGILFLKDALICREDTTRRNKYIEYAIDKFNDGLGTYMAKQKEDMTCVAIETYKGICQLLLGEEKLATASLVNARRRAEACRSDAVLEIRQRIESAAKNDVQDDNAGAKIILTLLAISATGILNPFLPLAIAAGGGAVAVKIDEREQAKRDKVISTIRAASAYIFNSSKLLSALGISEDAPRKYPRLAQHKNLKQEKTSDSISNDWSYYD